MRKRFNQAGMDSEKRVEVMRKIDPVCLCNKAQLLPIRIK